jgi:uncharacterized 2Fe-2S/4Fe-4S cluster protein (DUF4445 family)
MATVPLTFLPTGRTVAVAPGTRILQAAQAGGVDIEATCGGRGRCTSCRVKYVAGGVPPPTIMDTLQLGDDQVREGYRLSCQCPVDEPTTVLVAPPLTERSVQILGAQPPAEALRRVLIDAGVRKDVLTVTLPKDEHQQTPDLDALLSALNGAVAARGEAGARPFAPEDVGWEALRALPGALREDQGQVTVATFGGRVLAVEAGDTGLLQFGMAVDIGTTTVVSTLMELASGEQLAAVTSLNPQAVFGGDLMSRIAFAQADRANLRRLRTRIVGLLNEHVAELTRESGVLPRWIYKVVVVGNTVMHHALLGLDPSWVGLAPYAPVLRHPVTLPARELLLRVNPEAEVCLLPLVAGFVGADAVAVALATRIHELPETRIAVDIGTNGEVLLGSRERLWACSAPAGPALEGAQIRHGMRAALGAIDRAWLEAGDLRLHVLGEGAPQGLCGSGLLDAVAALLEAGALDWTGLIDLDARPRLPAPLARRLERRGEERVVVLLRPGELGSAREILLTQEDVRQVQLCKGAIASGVAMLQRAAGVATDRVAELLLAGGFGNYLSIGSALRIGLIPPLAPGRVRYVGNAAALGAQLCLMSEAERRRATDLARSIEHVSLAAHPDFQDVFVECMNFPREAPPGARTEAAP